MRKTSTLTDVIRQTIGKGDETLASICRATGLEKASLGRFMSGRQSLRLDKADALAAHLGLVLVKKDR